MAITFFGVGTNPADNSALAGPTVTITPPASMVDGDLVYVSVRYRDSAATIADAPAVDGGQTWNLTTQYNATNIRARVFWCRFDGTWDASPQFTVTAGTNNMDVQMLVFRPTSAAYTWTIESGPNGATYAAPSTPFTVTRTGRTTTAASTITIAAWHSVDDNTWGTLAGTGWSKTSLGAQYRNNSTADNSSTFAYYIATSASTAIPDVSQNQATLGGDAGSTSLFTFAETLVVVALTGLAATSAAGSLGISQSHSGLVGLESVASAGALVVPEGSGSNATGSPDGVAATAGVGTAATIATSVVVPTGAGVGTTAGTLLPLLSAVPVGVAATASAGTAGAIGSTPGIALTTGVVSNTAAGSLGIAITDVGIAGVESASAAGTLVASGGGIIHAAGQPSTVFVTAQVGEVAVSPLFPIQGVFATLTAEEVSAGSLLAEIDGVQGTLSAGSVSTLIGAPVLGVQAAAAVGSLAPIATVVHVPTGVQAVASVGTLAGVTAGFASAVAEGVESAAAAGTIAPAWTFDLTLAGVEATAAIGDVTVEAGDSAGVEVFPAGVAATTAVGLLSTGEVTAAAISVQAVTHAGNIGVSAATPFPPPTRSHGRHGRAKPRRSVHAKRHHRKLDAE